MFPRNIVETVPGYFKQVSGLEKVWLDTSFGKVEAWFLPPNRTNNIGAAPAVIFAHGNGELIDFWPQDLINFTHLGIGVFLVEYPGYGRSEGTPSQNSISETFVTAYDTLIDRKDVDPSRIILFGRSIGGGAVCELAINRPSAALILKSTMTSVRSMASKYFVPGFIVRDPFDNIAAVRAYRGPVLIMHGRHDEIISFSNGTDLFNAAKNGKMITYECGHNDCPPDWNIFWQDITSFLYEAKIIKQTGNILITKPY